MVGKATAKSLYEMTQRGRPGQVRLGFMGEAVTPDFNFFDFALGFDHMSLSSADGPRYFRPHPLLRFEHYFRPWFSNRNKSRIVTSNRDFLIDYVYSNRSPNPFRQEFFDLLSTRIEIRSYGSDRKNVAGFEFDYNVASEPKSGVAWINEKVALQAKHQFSISMENAKFDGYTSEKIMTSFAAGTIPIYWGNPSIESDFNPLSFVNVTHHLRPSDAVDEVFETISKPESISEMLRQPMLSAEQEKDLIKNREGLESFLRQIFINPTRHRGNGPAQKRYEAEFVEALKKRRYPPNRWTRSIVKRINRL